MATALALLLGDGHITVVSLLFLLATLLASARWGYGHGIFAAVVANLLLNFFFVQPLHRLAVGDAENLAVLGVFLAVAFVGAFMLSRLREQARRAVAHEAQTAVLLELSRETAQASTPRQALERLCTALARAAGARGCAVLSGEPLTVMASSMDSVSGTAPTRNEAAVAREALRSKEVARLEPNGPRPLTFVPLVGTQPAVLRFSGNVEVGTVKRPLIEAMANDMQAALERARLAAAANSAAELHRAHALQTVLLSSVSHDLRTPLTTIKAAISSLRDDSVAWTIEDRAAFLESIESQTDRLSRTVSNLLEMSRLESGTAQATLEAIEIGPLLTEVILATREVTREREVTQCAPDAAWLRADYGLLTLALTNLVENAAKYSMAGAPIRLEATNSPGRAFIRVVDAGPPIPADEIPLVFDKFFRGSTHRDATGSGLGLSIVKALVELCGGTVSVDSGVLGTAFTVSLPSATAPK